MSHSMTSKVCREVKDTQWILNKVNGVQKFMSGKQTDIVMAKKNETTKRQTSVHKTQHRK